MKDGSYVIGLMMVGAIFLFFTALFLVLPKYRVWEKDLTGQAQLKQATWNRQIKVREAEATKQSATLLAEAEVERAKGVAEANKIIANGLGGPEGYLRYLYIEGIKQAHENGAQIIYIPTEAGLPILEAQRGKSFDD